MFIWSMASWDVLGVYPEASTSQGSYRDQDVLAAVAAYNTAVRAAKLADPAGDTAAAASLTAATRDAPTTAAAAEGGVRVVVGAPTGGQEVVAASG